MRITIAVARRATLVAALLLALGAASASASPTTLDPTFDGDGIARPGVDRGQVLGRDLQGRVYVAGGGRLTRLRADGTRDLAYNGGNTVPTGLTITALAVLPNGGGAIVAGTDFDPGDDAHPIGVVLARYDEAGHYVPSYGSGGQARIPLPGTSTGEGDVVRDAVADPAGDVWVVGTREDRAYVVGVNANGEPMTTFGDPPATPGLRRLGTGTTFEAIARDADRRLVAVGSTTAGGTSPRWLAARFTETGRPDTTWDADGVSEPGSGATGTSLLRDVTVSGSTPSVGGIAADQGGVARLAGARLTSTGALDTSFGGGDGRVEAALGGGALPAGSGWIARDGNDTVLAGTAAGTGQIGVMRVDGAGRPDPFFTSDRSGLAVFKLGADQGELVRGVDAVGGKTLLAGDSTQTGGTGTGTGGGGTSSVPFVARLGDGEDQRPIAVATAKPATQSDGVEVLLDSSGSRDDQGAALSYAWGPRRRPPPRRPRRPSTSTPPRGPTRPS